MTDPGETDKKLNSVIAQYRDLSVSRRSIIDLLKEAKVLRFSRAHQTSRVHP